MTFRALQVYVHSHTPLFLEMCFCKHNFFYNDQKVFIFSMSPSVYLLRQSHCVQTNEFQRVNFLSWILLHSLCYNYDPRLVISILVRW